MNFAFPAFLLILFILPGFIFNLAFYKTENTPLNYIPLSHKAVVSFMVTIMLHVIWILSIYYIFSYTVNLELILMLVSGLKGEQFVATITSVTNKEIILASLYLLTMYSFAYCSGKSLRLGIRYFKWDKKKYSIFRIDSPWFYLFSGYDYEDGSPDGVRIGAVTEVAGEGYLYVGLLEKFYLDDKGNIDRLVLTGVARREIKKDKKLTKNIFAERFYPIDGHYFVLKYAEIKSLNVQFLKIEGINK